MSKSQSRIKRYGPVGVMLALLGVGISLASRYGGEVMTVLGFERRTVTETVWVSPWWMDAITLAVVVLLGVVVLFAPAIMPRGGFGR